MCTVAFMECAASPNIQPAIILKYLRLEKGNIATTITIQENENEILFKGHSVLGW